MSHRRSVTVAALLMALLAVAYVAAGAPAPAAAPPAPAPAATPPGEGGRGAAAEPEADQPQEPTVYELLEQGGYIMYPIYLLSVIMVAFAIERAVSLRRRRIVPPRFILNLRTLVTARPLDSDKIMTYCQANPSPISRIFQAAAKRLKRPLPEIEKTIEDAGAREVRLLRRNCRVLSGVAYISPLLGLLGTVLGMIKCFSQVSTGEALGKAERLAEGIYQALVTTAGGLTVAIPAAVLYLMFMAKIEKLVSEMDNLSLEFVESVSEDLGV